ncbi:sorbosone dehydrogenase family protein [Xanthomonas sp. XNM01]|uniref:PQQ-dependent sugar dehydrogenase n=1 Tax=Xanthomonas sp. XNM01 TaxID=2769289 RepID=UPI00177EFC8E|nr:sorbosone dehydrogenase family protein [Xanthomonas sp. XNM01]MBD9368618.1 sorbosone dehydrogenase family protein [Xanthomonas sp. XNM01]
MNGPTVLKHSKRSLLARALVPALALSLAACGGTPDETYVGTSPDLPKPQRGLFPTLKVSLPAEWGDQLPQVPEGYAIAPIADNLLIPRQMLVLPNGDILVAEGRGGRAPKLTPKDVIAGVIKARGNTQVQSGNRLTLLRDADGDGTYEGRSVFADGLDAPYGLAFGNDSIYVATQDALLRFDYTPGAVNAGGAPQEITRLPGAVNHHWTKALTISADGRYLFVGIGSDSNITERGLAVEENRAMIWQVDAQTGFHKVFATGLRNPTALAMQPGMDQLWAVVNERDEIGPELVPDYLTSVRPGGFYGWPYSYWGKNVDERVRPQRPDKVASAITPDFALGSHVAALGLAFSVPAMGEQFANGVFVGQHGSWNRNPPVGYKVSFVPFSNGKPSGEAIDFATGFLGEDGKARGRPVGVAVDPRGALLVADDLANTIWRITRTDAAAGAAPAPGDVPAGEPAVPPADASGGAAPSAPATPASDAPAGVQTPPSGTTPPAD